IAIVTACLAYMSWLSWQLLAFLLVLMAAGMFTYTIPLGRARRYMTRLRQETDALFKHFRGLIYGTKELKLHRGRRVGFLSSALAPTSQEIQTYSFLGNTAFTVASVWGNLLFILVMGLLLFLRPFGAATQ